MDDPRVRDRLDEPFRRERRAEVSPGQAGPGRPQVDRHRPAAGAAQQIEAHVGGDLV
jgi:hypothetical protein